MTKIDAGNGEIEVNGSWGPMLLAQAKKLGETELHEVMPFSTAPDAAKIQELMRQQRQLQQ